MLKGLHRVYIASFDMTVSHIIFFFKKRLTKLIVWYNMVSTNISIDHFTDSWNVRNRAKEHSRIICQSNKKFGREYTRNKNRDIKPSSRKQR